MNPNERLQQGVQALRDGDLAQGRDIALQLLKQDDTNEQVWLLLVKSLTDPQKQRICLQHILTLNPANATAQRWLAQLATVPTPQQLTTAQRQQIQKWEKEAKVYQKRRDDSSALNRWHQILRLQPDHENALRYAIPHLMQSGQVRASQKLLDNAVAFGTQNASIVLTAIDLYRNQGNHSRIDSLYEHLVTLNNVPTKDLLKMVEDLEKRAAGLWIIRLLDQAITHKPTDQQLLNRMGDLLNKQKMQQEALNFFERSVQVNAQSKQGRYADKQLSNSVPVITDSIRGSIGLAWREAIGITLVFFLMAFQDAGLNISQMTLRHILGIVIALVGGYLVVTATTSPQQHPIAGWLGGKVSKKKNEPKRKVKTSQAQNTSSQIQVPTSLPKIPTLIRIILGGLGSAMLVIAFVLVFATAIFLLQQDTLILDSDYYRFLDYYESVTAP